MSVRNIDKGYIGTDSGTIDTSGYDIVPLTFSGVVTTVNAVFNKYDGIVTLTLPPVYGPSTSPTSQIVVALPSQYQEKTGIQCSQFTYVSSYDSTGTVAGMYPGCIIISNGYLDIMTIGNNATGMPVGLPNYTTIAYLTETM